MTKEEALRDLVYIFRFNKYPDRLATQVVDYLDKCELVAWEPGREELRQAALLRNPSLSFEPYVEPPYEAPKNFNLPRKYREVE